MPIQILEEAKDSITSVCILGSLIVTGSVDGYVRTYDVRKGELRVDYFERRSSCLEYDSHLSYPADLL